MNGESIEVKKDYYYYDNGILMYERHYLKDMSPIRLHNPNNPALRMWYKNGKLRLEEYWVNGKINREGGPASKLWNCDGRLIREGCYINSKRHCEDGPALRGWFKNRYYEINFVNNRLTIINGYIFRLYCNDELVYQI